MSNRTGMRVPSPRQLCGHCGTAVTRHRGGGIDATHQDETGQLFHGRCWRRYRKERRKAERAELREIERRLFTPTEGDLVMDDLQQWLGKGLAAQKAVDEIIPRPLVEARAVYATPKPAKPPKEPPALHQPPQEPAGAPGNGTGAIIPARARKGVQRAVAQFVGSQPPGQWWHMQQVANHVTGLGITTTIGTIQATVSQLVTARGLERFRVGNLRAYRFVPAPDGVRLEEAAIPEIPVPRIEPPAPQERAARAIDRAMNDLSALIGELIAETRRELRKELGA